MQTISSSVYRTLSNFVTYLSDGWEANESNRGYPGSRNIEAHTTTTAPTARRCGDKLTSKFCKLRLELPQMIAGGLILLSFRPSGVRIGQKSLEEGGHTSSLWSDERAGNYGSREAYHLIFYFLSEEISVLFVKWREG
jgi:hypothetical protein